MLKISLALALVCSMYVLFLWGQALGAEAFLADAREEQTAIITDYESALFSAQKEYDALLDASNLAIAKLENALAIERDTLDWYRAELGQRSAEASRWKSLAGYRGN